MSDVHVHCYLPQGLRLTINQTNAKTYQNVSLKNGRNVVDADFWAQWVSENADYAPFANGQIIEVEPETVVALTPPEEAAPEVAPETPAEPAPEPATEEPAAPAAPEAAPEVAAAPE